MVSCQGPSTVAAAWLPAGPEASSKPSARARNHLEARVIAVACGRQSAWLGWGLPIDPVRASLGEAKHGSKPLCAHGGAAGRGTRRGLPMPSMRSTLSARAFPHLAPQPASAGMRAGNCGNTSSAPHRWHGFALWQRPHRRRLRLFPQKHPQGTLKAARMAQKGIPKVSPSMIASTGSAAANIDQNRIALRIVAAPPSASMS